MIKPHSFEASVPSRNRPLGTSLNIQLGALGENYGKSPVAAISVGPMLSEEE